MGKQPTASNMRQVFSLLNEMRKDRILDNYAAGGAVAAMFFVEPASTMDIDVFVTLKPDPGKTLLSLEPIYTYLKARGAIVEDQYVVYAGWPLQFLPANSPLVAEALDQAQELDDDGLAVRVFGLEHLAAIALEVGRLKDKVRLEEFVNSGRMDMVNFETILHRHRLEQRYADWLKWRKST